MPVTQTATATASTTTWTIVQTAKTKTKRTKTTTGPETAAKENDSKASKSPKSKRKSAKKSEKKVPPKKLLLEPESLPASQSPRFLTKIYPLKSEKLDAYEGRVIYKRVLALELTFLTRPGKSVLSGLFPMKSDTLAHHFRAKVTAQKEVINEDDLDNRREISATEVTGKIPALEPAKVVNIVEDLKEKVSYLKDSVTSIFGIKRKE